MRQIPAHKRAKFTGKGATATFTMIAHSILRSRQFITLEPWAKHLLMVWAGVYNGKNNGDFSAARHRYREYGFNSPATLDKAKATLITSGFAIITRHGHNRVCSLYGVTIWPLDDCNGKSEIGAERYARNTWKKTESAGHVVSHSGTAAVPKPLLKAA